MEKVIMNARDGYKLDLAVYETESAVAAVQIVHGMEEHMGRYEDFALYLNKKGFNVILSNMRGHGENAPQLGYFKDKDGYKELTEDQKTVTSYIKDRFPSLPVFIFAHSMGTIITRVLLQTNSADYAKAALSGYPCYQTGTSFGIFLSDVIKKFRGAKYKSKLLSSLSIGSFNKKIKNPRTDFDWVCSNEETVDKYIKDPLCGFGFTTSALGDLFRLVKLMHSPKRYEKVNTSMPILLLRGEDDPCTGGDKGAKDSVKVLEKAGFLNISEKVYSGMRHEILNEKDKMIVFADAADFFLK